MGISDTVMEHARRLWSFHQVHDELSRSDIILGLGSRDRGVAKHAAKLFLEGFADTLVFSGGQGKVTKGIWDDSEASQFERVAVDLGVPRSKIVLETQATNTGENITNTRALLKQIGMRVGKAILVTKPYMARRALATARKQWPEVFWLVSFENASLEEYISREISATEVINLMVGDLQRLRLYASLGLQEPVEIPDEIWESYEALRGAGFDRYVISEETK